MLKKFLGTLTLILLGVALGFIILEIGFRCLEPRNDIFIQSHPLLGWFNKPGQRGTYANADFKNQIQINSRGLRDVEHSLEKPAGVYRIIILGDSFMEALQVSLEDSFPRQLEKMLQEHLKDKKIEVINLGCSGFGTAQECLALKHFGLPYKPDLVIMAFCLSNDVWDNYFKKYKIIKAPSEHEIDRTIILQPLDNSPSMMETLKKKSKVINYLFIKLEESDKIYKLMVKLKLISSDRRQKEVFSTFYSEDWKKAWELTFSLIQETQELSESHGSKFLLVSLTEMILLRDEASRRNLLSQGIDTERPEKILQDFSRQHGISYLALVYPFRHYMIKYNLQAKDFHIPGDYHWTPLGHRLAATLVQQRIRQDQNLGFLINNQHTPNTSAKAYPGFPIKNSTGG